MPDWVTVAVLGRPRGNKGELQATSLSDSPGRFESLSRAFLFRNETALGERPVERCWFHDGRLVVKFAAVDSISAAEELAGAELRVPFSERAPLEPGAYFQSDLIGCDLFGSGLLSGGSDAPLGRVTGCEELGGPILLEIDGDWLVPFTPAICKAVDVAARRILVDLPEGLRDLNRS